MAAVFQGYRVEGNVAGANSLGDPIHNPTYSKHFKFKLRVFELVVTYTFGVVIYLKKKAFLRKY